MSPHRASRRRAAAVVEDIGAPVGIPHRTRPTGATREILPTPELVTGPEPERDTRPHNRHIRPLDSKNLTGVEVVTLGDTPFNDLMGHPIVTDGQLSPLRRGHPMPAPATSTVLREILAQDIEMP